MSETPSIVTRGDRVFDDLRQLWNRRRVLCIGIIVFLLSPSIILISEKFWGKSQLQSKVSSLEAELADTKRDRDAKAAQLAPFLALANQRFETAPPDKRLDLLLERVETLTETVRETAKTIGKRQVSQSALSRIQAKLDFAERVPIQIDGVLGDSESLLLAEQLKSLFEGAGYSVKGVNQGVWSKPISGLLLRAKKAPHGDLADAIAMIFVEVGQKPTIAINDADPEGQLTIIVGSK